VLDALLDAASISELHGGHQSRVFLATDSSGEMIVAKVTDASLVDRTIFATRVDVVAELGDVDRRVCRPMPVDDRLVTEIEFGGQLHLLVCYEYAHGDAVDNSDAELMGRTLAGLHRSMAQLDRVDLPAVAALSGSTSDEDQLIHGDFNSGNLRRRDGAVRVFDFDDCGYGPVEFDVANALYMVLFDAVTSGVPAAYSAFRERFVVGYRSAVVRQPTDEALDRFIARRVEALRGWLDDLQQAPIGIRTATPEWHAVLRSFVETYPTVH
jgi:Ser/Thr protein kinase RdoA (MazF antagonist)